MSAAKRVNELMLNLEESYTHTLNNEKLIDHPLTRLGFIYGMKRTMDEFLVDESFDVKRMVRTALEHEIARLIAKINELESD